jgi:hypothetical protein
MQYILVGWKLLAVLCGVCAQSGFLAQLKTITFFPELPLAKFSGLQRRFGQCSMFSLHFGIRHSAKENNGKFQMGYTNSELCVSSDVGWHKHLPTC